MICGEVDRKTLVSQGNRARRRAGYNNCNFCGHGADKAHRTTSTAREGWGRWICESAPRSGELRRRASEYAVDASRWQAECATSKAEHTHDDLIPVACGDEFPRVHGSQSVQTSGFFGVVATDAHDGSREPQFHLAESDEAMQRLASNHTTTVARAPAVASADNRYRRRSAPRRRPQVSSGRKTGTGSPKPNVSSLSRVRGAAGTDDGQVFSVSTATTLTRIFIL